MTPQRLNYSSAVTACATMGATLYAPRDADDFKFFPDWGDTQFQDDLLIGVRRLQGPSIKDVRAKGGGGAKSRHSKGGCVLQIIPKCCGQGDGGGPKSRILFERPL